MQPSKGKNRQLLPYQIRPINKEWRRKVKEFVNRLAADLDVKKIPVSSIMRQSFETERQEWRKHPYVCTSAKHFLFINSDGDYYYYFSEKMEANVFLERIPIYIDMKPEKIDYYLREYFVDHPDIAQSFRNIWLFNKFWIRANSGSILFEEEDRIGLTSKTVHAPLSIHEKSVFFREGLAVLKQYAKWPLQRSKMEFDFCGFSALIPTRNIEITVVIEHGLFKPTDFGEGYRPSLDYEFRNKDSFVIPNKNADRILEPEKNVYPGWEKVQNIYPLNKENKENEEDNPEYEHVIGEIDRYISKIKEHVSSSEIVTCPNPTNYSFYYLKMPVFNKGMTLVMKWPLPK